MVKKIKYLYIASSSFLYAAHEYNNTAIMKHNSTEHHMHGMYGRYDMDRESSGTSWEPEATHMPGIYGMHHTWGYMIQTNANIIFDHQRGRRGEKKFFSENMIMGTIQKDIGSSTFAFRGMFSFEPGTMGKSGYPLLLQTGETANGKTPLIDRQHPHNFFMELAAVYTIAWKDSSFFMYAGMPGEPALGPPVYIMRFSSLYNPETPIIHHWMDSTHITFGVITAGYTWKWLKIDGSIFTGREPDQHRWSFNRPRFSSPCIRLSINPTENWALQISYGYLKSPEQLEPCVNIDRLTASASYQKTWHDNQWQTTAAWGRNMNNPGPNLDGFLLESTIEIHKKYVLFGRAEYVAKDGLFKLPDPRAHEIFKVGKFNGGTLYEPFWWKDIQVGFGLCGSIIMVPESLKQSYSGDVFSYMVFMRIALRQ
jgi:hypothetical protein